MPDKTYTLELTEAERDMLRDFAASYFPEYMEDLKDQEVCKSLYNKIDNLDPEEVGAS